MDKETAHWILDVQDAALEDKLYQQIHAQYRLSNEKLLVLLESLTEEQQTVILDFIGNSVELYHRIMEIAYKSKFDVPCK